MRCNTRARLRLLETLRRGPQRRTLDRLVSDVAPQNLEVVAVVEGVVGHGSRLSPRGVMKKAGAHNDASSLKSTRM